MIAQSSKPIPPLSPQIAEAIEVIRSFSPEQQQQALDFVEFLAQKHQIQPPRKTIWEKMRERAAQIPAEEWEKWPIDGSYHHDR